VTFLALTTFAGCGGSRETIVRRETVETVPAAPVIVEKHTTVEAVPAPPTIVERKTTVRSERTTEIETE
jgi:hypothetical protein